MIANPFFAISRARKIQSVKNPAFFENNAFAAVDVFAAALFRVNLPGAETDDAPLFVPDRENEPVAEKVEKLPGSLFTLGYKSPLLHLVYREPFPCRPLNHAVPEIRGGADHEFLGKDRVETAGLEIFRGFRGIAVHQIRPVPRRQLLVQEKYALPQIVGGDSSLLVLSGIMTALRFGNDDIVFACKHLSGVGELEILDHHDELEHVSAFAAAEAVKCVRSRVYDEGRRLLLMKRQHAFQRCPAC